MDSSLKISCTLIPQDGLNILIPNSAIEEVIKVPLEGKTSGSPANILGYAKWKDTKIVVFTANPGLTPGPLKENGSATVVLVKNPDFTTPMGFYASHNPRSTQASQRSLVDDPSPGYINSYASRYISIDDQQAIIPNLNLCFSNNNQ